MTSQNSNTSIVAETGKKELFVLLLTALFLSGGSDSEELESIGQDEFRILMSLVVVATLAFGCTINGWLF